LLRRIFEPKRDNVKRELRKLHYKKLNDLYSSPNIVQVIKFKRDLRGSACSMYGGDERCI
jgi:hypothetical protein